MFSLKILGKKALPILLCAIMVISSLPFAVLTAVAQEHMSTEISEETTEPEVKDEEKDALLDTPILSSVSADNSGVTIKWGTVTGAEKYRVFYKTGSGNWTKIADTTAASCLWKSAVNGTKYTYTVRCVSSDGKTYTSSYDSTGLSLTAVATPKISSAGADNSGTIIKWGAVSGAEKYRVYRKTANTSWIGLTDTTSTSFIDNTATNGTKYTYTVRCVTADGKAYASGYDTAGKAFTAFSTPKLSSVSADNTGTIIKWNNVTGAENYKVFRKTSGGSWTAIGTTISAGYSDKTAKNGTEYFYTVRCVNSGGGIYTSGYDNAGMGIKAVATPNISSVSADNPGTVIKWNAVSGAVRYRVYRKTAGTSWVGLTDTTSTGFTDNTAIKGTKYTYTVRCVTADGKAYASGYDTAGKTFTAFANPKVSSVVNAATGVTVTWGKVSDAAKYRVFYKTGNGSWTKIADTASTSYTWTGAKSNTTYTFTVRCVTSDGKTFTSGYDTTGKSIKYIATPQLSSVANVATGIQLKWNAVSGASKYRVFYKTGNGNWTKIADTTSTSYIWTGAKGGTRYTFTVRCVSDDGNSYISSFDGTGKSITYIIAPKLSYAVNIATGTLITWEKSTGAAKYRVFYKTGNGSWTKIGDTTSTALTWTGAKSGTKYTFTVRCVSSDGKSYTSSYDSKGITSGTTFTTSKGYQGVVKNGVVYIDGYLIANKTYPLPESYGSGITSATQTAFDKMKAAAKKDGITLYISSGFRSYSTQKRIYNNYVSRDGRAEADTYSARPGYSEHQSGLALDLNIIGNAFNGTTEQKWLEKNCYKYGFILRYPKGKTNETGYVYESWHFRYVGEELAKKLYNGGNWITMEDYYGFTSEYC